ncbi:hypothetical protein CHS0354_002293 [Potamilus streckersoni]|uniref:Uncharacterized protein n=1 Tax=Potamilus streckersoni TaxID=2493646 RepID=A0AAE0SNR6_9BIVA|nr:hypothetical protein CHS0354_002293 [Potamilus streckersoni]
MDHSNVLKIAVGKPVRGSFMTDFQEGLWQTFREFYGRLSGRSMADFQKVLWQTFREFYGRLSGSSMADFQGVLW